MVEHSLCQPPALPFWLFLYFSVSSASWDLGARHIFYLSEFQRLPSFVRTDKLKCSSVPPLGLLFVLSVMHGLENNLNRICSEWLTRILLRGVVLSWERGLHPCTTTLNLYVQRKADPRFPTDRCSCILPMITMIATQHTIKVALNFTRAFAWWFGDYIAEFWSVSFVGDNVVRRRQREIDYGGPCEIGMKAKAGEKLSEDRQRGHKSRGTVSHQMGNRWR